MPAEAVAAFLTERFFLGAAGHDLLAVLGEDEIAEIIHKGQEPVIVLDQQARGEHRDRAEAEEEPTEGVQRHHLRIAVGQIERKDMEEEVDGDAAEEPAEEGKRGGFGAILGNILKNADLGEIAKGVIGIIGLAAGAKRSKA